MTRHLYSSRRAALAGVAALLLGLASAAPAGAAAYDGATVHHRARGVHRAAAWRGRAYAVRHGHRHARFLAAVPGLRYGATELPAGYASDESPYNVQAEDNDFDTGAFYGCLHNVLTAGGYRPVATCD